MNGLSMMDTPDSLRQRRDLLITTPAPQPRHDAVVILENGFGDIHLRLRYVPDRDVLLPDSFGNYVDAIGALDFSSFEATAQTILEDINDQVIPSWLEVTLRQSTRDTHHEVRIEDRQPGWKDRGLLDRLAP
jgi:7-cyano-7-deazaguanine reductase